jgi:hypothetical protein
MGKSIRCRRVSHPNIVLMDYDASIARLQDLYGARLMMDMPKPEWHANLMDIGGMIFEFFAPPNFLLNSRHGPHILGVEYEANMTEVREVLAAHNVRVFRELQVAVHCNPVDCYGVDFEFYEGSFFDNDPPHLKTLVNPVSWWRDEHPLGLAGLKAYTLGVSEITEATRFIQSFVSGEVVYEKARPAIGAQAVGLQVADCVVELLTPTGPGSFQRELQRMGQGIHSMVFNVKSLDQAKRYFAGKGVEMIEGTAPGRLTIPPEANCGVNFEFEE